VNNLNFQLIESSCNRFYADEDVRARSVCEVTSSVAVDTLGTAIPNGVYDPRMGPTKADNPPCTTCALRFHALVTLDISNFVSLYTIRFCLEK
jgi:hypothetical protein